MEWNTACHKFQWYDEMSGNMEVLLVKVARKKDHFINKNTLLLSTFGLMGDMFLKEIRQHAVVEGHVCLREV